MRFMKNSSMLDPTIASQFAVQKVLRPVEVELAIAIGDR
jgi:hypothetical protein